MHEHGVADRTMRMALDCAASQGGELAGLRVRLGALFPGDERQFRGLLEHVLEHLGRQDVSLEIVVDQARPAGVELLSIELRASVE